MRDLMNLSNPFWRFMTRLFDLAILNILWLLACIPIVTFGASTAAMLAAAMKIVRNEEISIWKDFWKAWRSNLKQGIFLGLILLGLTAVFSFDLWYFAVMQSRVTGLAWALICLLFTFALAIVSVTGIYSLLLLPLFNNTVLETLRNGFFMALHYPLRSIGVLAVSSAGIAALFRALVVSPPALFVILLFGGALAALIQCMILRPVLRDYLPEERKETEE